MQYGLIGEKLGHSYSERIHNMIGGYEYRLCPLSPEGMRALLKSRDFRGLNVTIPYKKDVLPFCDVLSEEVRRIGSANTLVNRDGALIAYNTDIGGLRGHGSDRRGPEQTDGACGSAQPEGCSGP